MKIILKNVPKCVFVSLVLLTLTATQAGYAKILAPATSKQADPLLITLSSQKVQTTTDGKETLVNADKVKPGDIVQYKAIYHNRGKAALTGLNASLPVPFGMQYVEKSALPRPVLATIDNIKYEEEPLMRTLKNEDGKESQVAVPYSNYQSLRWEIGKLEGGKKITVTARMQINNPAKSAAELVTNPAVPATPAINN